LLLFEQLGPVGLGLGKGQGEGPEEEGEGEHLFHRKKLKGTSQVTGLSGGFGGGMGILQGNGKRWQHNMCLGKNVSLVS
jgi:hypothetical protein